MLNQKEEESLSSMLYRASVNTFHRADIFCRKTERNAKLAVKKLQLRQVKKSFGIDYMTLLEKEANPDELDRCLRDGHEKMGNINKDIRTLRAEKTSLDDMLKQKLVRKPDVQASVEPSEHQHTQDSEPASVGIADARTDVVKSDVEKPKDEVIGDKKPNPQPMELGETSVVSPFESEYETEQEEEFVVLPELREKPWDI